MNKKFLLSVLSIVSLTAFSQWQSSFTIYSTGNDCVYAFSKVLASDDASNTINQSSDDGNTWSSANSGVPTGTAISFGGYSGGTLYGYFNNNIFKTTTGNSWSTMTSPIPASDKIKSMAVINGTVFAATNPVSGNGAKIYKLTGSTWSLQGSIPIAIAGLVNSIANINGALWAATTTTLAIKSPDFGATWTNASTTFTGGATWYDKDAFCLNSNGTYIFMGVYNGKLLKSGDGGSTWSVAYNTGNGGTWGMNDIYILSSSNILVGTDSGFVYSTNGGVSFTKDNSGLNYSNQEFYLRKLAVSTGSIIASTASGTIVRRPITQIFSGINELQFSNIESKAYPNPASDVATIEANDLVTEENCMVKMHDVLGREVSATEMKNGKAIISLGNLNKGIYTYSIYHNNVVVGTGKLVVK